MANEGQLEELEALQAYYKDTEDVILNVVTSFEEAADLSLEAKVSAELPAPVEVCGNMVEKRLPPITLRVVMQSEYLDDDAGSCIAPHFTVFASWLNRRQLSILCKELDALWNDCGGPIVLVWIESLRSDTWTWLEIGNKLTFDPWDSVEQTDCDERAEASDQLCGFCHDKKPSDAFVSMGDCAHAFCADCVNFTIRLHQKAGAKPKCPVVDCRCTIAENVIRTVPDDEQSSHDLQQQATGTMLEDAFTTCPRCQSYPCPMSHTGLCPDCGWLFCVVCRCKSSDSHRCNMDLHQLIERAQCKPKIPMSALMKVVQQSSYTFEWQAYTRLPFSDIAQYEVLASKIITSLAIPEEYLRPPTLGDYRPIQKALLHLSGLEKVPFTELLPQEEDHQTALRSTYVSKDTCLSMKDVLTWHFPFFVNSQTIEMAVLRWLKNVPPRPEGLLPLRACQHLGLRSDPAYEIAAIRVAQSLHASNDFLIQHDVCSIEVENAVLSLLQTNTPLDLLQNLQLCEKLGLQTRLWYREQLRRLAKALQLPGVIKSSEDCTTVQTVEIAAQEHLKNKIAALALESNLAWTRGLQYCDYISLGIAQAAIQCLGPSAHYEADLLDKMSVEIVAACGAGTRKQYEDRCKQLSLIAAHCGCHDLVKDRHPRTLAEWEETTQAFEDVLAGKVMKWLEAEVLDFADLLRRFRAVSDLKLHKNGMYKAKVNELGKVKLSELKKQFCLPASWTLSDVQQTLASHDRLSMMDINLTPGGLQAFQRLFDLSFRRVSTVDRRGRPTPHRLVVTHVEQVRNLDVWADYVVRRSELVAQASAVCDKDLKQPITSNWWLGACSDDEASFLEKLEPLESDANEQLLFHGTSKECAAKIVGSNFRLKLAGTNAGTLYGRGIYMAESVTKSDEYSTDGTILICRVSLGSVLYTDEHYPNTRQLEEQCCPGLQGELNKFQSVLGDREKIRGTFREFIVFDEQLVYPEFVVHYESDCS